MTDISTKFISAVVGAGLAFLSMAVGTALLQPHAFSPTSDDEVMRAFYLGCREVDSEPACITALKETFWGANGDRLAYAVFGE